MSIVLRGLLFVLALLLAPASVAAADAEKPSLVVVLERETILANQAVTAHVWIENPTKSPLTDLSLSLQGPTFLTLGRDDGAGRCDTSRPMTLPSTVAAGGASPPLRLCVKASDSVLEEDVNLAFSLGYRQKLVPPQDGFVIVEKRLKVGLLGTDSVAGVSLRLISFFLPGALALMLLRLLKVSWVISLNSTEVAIFAVIVSTLVSPPALWLGAQSFWPAPPGRTGVSLALLVTTCVVAICLTGAILVIRWLWILAAKAHRERLLVADGDDDKSALRKALEGARGDFQPVKVRSGTEDYVGSAVAPRRGGGLVLFGWFRIDGADAQTRATLVKLLAEEKYVEALKLPGARVSLSSNIRKVSTTGLTPTKDLRLVLAAKRKPERVPGGIAELPVPDPPLVMP